jgi:hypothetical protein
VPQAIIVPWGPPLVLPSLCLGTAALAVVAPWEPSLLPSLRLGDCRSSCRRRCHARRRPTLSPCREEAVTALDGDHRRHCPAARCGGTVAVPEVIEEATLKHRAASRLEEVAPSRGRRKPCPRVVAWHRANLLLASLRRKNEMRI